MDNKLWIFGDSFANSGNTIEGVYYISMALN